MPSNQSSFIWKLFSFARFTTFFSCFLILFFIIMIVVSLFTYALFYLIYMPQNKLTYYIHWQFRVHPNGKMSFPTANIDLSMPNNFWAKQLTPHQDYRVTLDLKLPDSHANRNLGMFMCNIQMLNKQGDILQFSQRQAILRYRSNLIRLVRTFILTPLFLTSLLEETQAITIDLLQNFVDKKYDRATHAMLQIENRGIEIYSSSLNFKAQYHGIKYFVHEWPILTAFYCVLINSACITGIIAIFYLKYMLFTTIPTKQIKNESTPLTLKKDNTNEFNNYYSKSSNMVKTNSFIPSLTYHNENNDITGIQCCDCCTGECYDSLNYPTKALFCTCCCKCNTALVSQENHDFNDNQYLSMLPQSEKPIITQNKNGTARLSVTWAHPIITKQSPKTPNIKLENTEEAYLKKLDEFDRILAKFHPNKAHVMSTRQTPPLTKLKPIIHTHQHSHNGVKYKNAEHPLLVEDKPKVGLIGYKTLDEYLRKMYEEVRNHQIKQRKMPSAVFGQTNSLDRLATKLKYLDNMNQQLELIRNKREGNVKMQSLIKGLTIDVTPSKSNSCSNLLDFNLYDETTDTFDDVKLNF